MKYRCLVVFVGCAFLLGGCFGGKGTQTVQAVKPSRPPQQVVKHFEEDVLKYIVRGNYGLKSKALNYILENQSEELTVVNNGKGGIVIKGDPVYQQIVDFALSETAFEQYLDMYGKGSTGGGEYAEEKE